MLLPICACGIVWRARIPTGNKPFLLYQRSAFTLAYSYDRTILPHVEKSGKKTPDGAIFSSPQLKLGVSENGGCDEDTHIFSRKL
jgi:hypothetical protein